MQSMDPTTHKKYSSIVITLLQFSTQWARKKLIILLLLSQRNGSVSMDEEPLCPDWTMASIHSNVPGCIIHAMNPTTQTFHPSQSLLFSTLPSSNSDSFDHGVRSDWNCLIQSPIVICEDYALKSFKIIGVGIQKLWEANQNKCLSP